MTIARIIGIILLAAGVGLVVYGWSISDTLGAELERELTGEDDETLGYLIGGIVAGLAGLLLLIFGGRRSRPDAAG
jgi:LPXTG-motif cell wall-anchored protein